MIMFSGKFCVVLWSLTSVAFLSNGHEPVTMPATTLPHCEVPCGIYADQMRFEQMLEDTATIAKSITSIQEYATAFSQGPPTAKDINQVTRWVTTKETHATNTQHIIAQYFLTQRIKPEHADYTKQLAAAHAVIVTAMKCKQDADPATAESLKQAIYALYRAYEGKEPQFDEGDAKEKGK
jgi:nickel superoxide dismutase